MAKTAQDENHDRRPYPPLTLHRHGQSRPIAMPQPSAVRSISSLASKPETSHLQKIGRSGLKRGMGAVAGGYPGC